MVCARRSERLLRPDVRQPDRALVSRRHRWFSSSSSPPTSSTPACFPAPRSGCWFGDLVYTWMAFRLAKRTGNRFVTAMPLGLDTPSTIGMTLVVLGPAFVGLKAEGMSEHDAANDDLVHRHGHDGHDRDLQGRAFVCRSVGPAGRAAGGAARVAGRDRHCADRSCAARGHLRHAGDWDVVARPDALLTGGAFQAAGQRAWRAGGHRSGNGRLLLVRRDRMDGRIVLRPAAG